MKAQVLNAQAFTLHTCAKPGRWMYQAQIQRLDNRLPDHNHPLIPCICGSDGKGVWFDGAYNDQN